MQCEIGGLDVCSLPGGSRTDCKAPPSHGARQEQSRVVTRHGRFRLPKSFDDACYLLVLKRNHFGGSRAVVRLPSCEALRPRLPMRVMLGSFE
jgi:hypothetical protein